MLVVADAWCRGVQEEVAVDRDGEEVRVQLLLLSTLT